MDTFLVVGLIGVVFFGILNMARPDAPTIIVVQTEPIRQESGGGCMAAALLLVLVFALTTMLA